MCVFDKMKQKKRNKRIVITHIHDFIRLGCFQIHKCHSLPPHACSLILNYQFNSFNQQTKTYTIISIRRRDLFIIIIKNISFALIYSHNSCLLYRNANVLLINVIIIIAFKEKTMQYIFIKLFYIILSITQTFFLLQLYITFYVYIDKQTIILQNIPYTVK